MGNRVKEDNVIHKKLWKLKNPEKLREQKKRYRLKYAERDREKRAEAKRRSTRLKALGIPNETSLRKEPADVQARIEALLVEREEKRLARIANPAIYAKEMQELRRKRRDNDWKGRIAKYGDPTNCEICGVAIKAQSGNTGACWDHDHDRADLPEEQQFRGWLCGHCNSALGLLKDSPEILLKAAAYLQKHEIDRARFLVRVA